MRIHLNLPSPVQSSSSVASTSSTTLSCSLLSAAPAPLTALTPNGELILIELQGALEIENQSPSGGQILGTVSFEPTRPDRPILIISHHRLEGKFVNLIRPLAVLEKKIRADKLVTGERVSVERNGKRVAQEPVGTVKRAKPLEESDANHVLSSSPLLLSPKRSRDALDFSSSPPRQTPIKAKPVAKATQLNDIDENGASDQNPTHQDEEEEEEDEEEPQTAVYYDVVSVIKRKILFSKRPEPIVRLENSSTLTPVQTKT